MDRPRTAIARWILKRWPIPIGLRYLIKMVPNPPPGLVTKEISRSPLRLEFDPLTYMGKFLYYRGSYEEAIVKKVEALLRPGMTFIDVGANIGLYSVVAASLVGSAGKVVAFEPQPELVKLLRSNIYINKLNNIVEIEAVALGGKAGEEYLYQVSLSNDGQATLRLLDNEQIVGRPVAVPVRTLDSVLTAHGIKKIHGIKIDVEGAELSVLEGFRGCLAGNDRPDFIYVECIDQHMARFGNSSAELFLFLRNYGYSLSSLRMGRWSPMNERRDSSHSAHILAVR